MRRLIINGNGGKTTVTFKVKVFIAGRVHEYTTTADAANYKQEIESEMLQAFAQIPTYQVAVNG